MQETWIWCLRQEDPLEKAIATHSSILVWRIPWTEEPDGLLSMGSHRVRHNWATNTFTCKVFNCCCSVAQLCLTLSNPMDCSTPGFPVLHHLPELASNSCPLSQWCHPAILSSVIRFSSCLQSFPASGSFPVSQFFASGGQSIRVSASASVLPMNIQDWFPLGLTGLVSL